MVNYDERLQHYKCKSTEDIINMCTNSIPKEYIGRPWTNPELCHGVNLLDSTSSLDCYMAAYGEMHQTKCRVALQNLDFDKKAVQ